MLLVIVLMEPLIMDRHNVPIVLINVLNALPLQIIVLAVT